MTMIKLSNVKKYYGDRLVLNIDKLEIQQNDRIGIVGKNGTGKTTLLKAILGIEAIDEGNISLDADYAYISQNELNINGCKEDKVKSILHVPDEYSEYLSGGEKVKLSIAKALQSNSNLLIADEPTANLDYQSIKAIEKLINEYKGTLLLVSHDREFLNNLCTSILEIDNGHVKVYKGNYSRYVELKQEEEENEKREYEKYISEKQRLEKAIISKEKTRDSIRKVPKRMGNSEARLHRKMGNQKSKKNLDGNIKAIKSRINHLEEKEKPIKDGEFYINVIDSKKIDSKNIITINHLDLYAENKLLVKDINFKIANGQKIGIIGDNGSGKTTLLKAILKQDYDNIKLSNKISIGYFDQHQYILNDDKTIIENILESSSCSESLIRLNLASFGFKQDTIYKKVSVLSGGEKVKVALFKVLASDNNTLLLDEPTNFLDIKSIEALEKAILNTDKTVLLVSHDKSFVANVCNSILEIKDKRSMFFKGTYTGFSDFKENEKLKANETVNKRMVKEKIMLLEYNLSNVISKLSLENNDFKKLELDNEYIRILSELKDLKFK